MRDMTVTMGEYPPSHCTRVKHQYPLPSQAKLIIVQMIVNASRARDYQVSSISLQLKQTKLRY